MMLLNSALFSTIALLGVTIIGCSQPEPTVVARSVSPDGKFEVAMFHDAPGSIMDDSLLFTINTPNAKYDIEALAASIKRSRQLHFYWTSDGQLVLSAREIDGWVHTGKRIETGFPGFVLCSASTEKCETMFVPLTSNNGIRLTEYHSQESEPLENQK